MKYLKKFNEDITATISHGVIKPSHLSVNNIYNEDWKKFLPEEISINYHNKIYKFKKNNIMTNVDMLQITYSSVPEEIWGKPDTLEFDIYFAKEDDNDDQIVMNIDITYGDLIACEFSIEPPNKVKLIQQTSKGSKFDPSNTKFALSQKSLESLVNFFNKFKNMKLEINNLKFLL